MRHKVKRNSHVWARADRDYYIEPEWCDDALFRAERFRGGVLDPACGSGRIVKAALRRGLDAMGADVVRRRQRFPFTFMHRDFLAPTYPDVDCDNIVSNPPYRDSLMFAKLALQRARKVALLMPLAWLTGDTRAQWIAESPLKVVYVLTPRPSMPPGFVIERGEKPEGGRLDFAWFVWSRNFDGAPSLKWLRRDQ